MRGKDYQRICGDRDQSYSQTVNDALHAADRRRAASRVGPTLTAVALGLAGLIDQLWQGILFEGDDFDRDAAKRQCRAYLCSVFPWLADRIEATRRRRQRVELAAGSATPTDPALRHTLPAWVYHSEEFHELEKERLFCRHGRSSVMSASSLLPGTMSRSNSSAGGASSSVMTPERCVPLTTCARIARTRSWAGRAVIARNS